MKTRLILIASLVVLIVISAVAYQVCQPASKPILEPIPSRTDTIYEKLDFSLTDLYGSLVSGSDYAGKYVIVNFWATWCV